MAWISPTGHIDPDTQWSNEPNAYDEIEASQAASASPGHSWSAFLELTHAAINCDKVRFHAPFNGTQNGIDLDVYYDGDWHHVYQGIYTSNEWVEKDLGSSHSVTAARVSFYNDFFAVWNVYLNEFDFNEVEGVTHELTARGCRASHEYNSYCNIYKCFLNSRKNRKSNCYFCGNSFNSRFFDNWENRVVNRYCNCGYFYPSFSYKR